MKVFLYEHLTGGGSFESAGDDPPSGSLLAEGAAMALAMAEDLLRCGCQVTAMRDARLRRFVLAGCRTMDVASAAEQALALRRGLAESDAAILIAPEIDGALLRQTRLAAECGARLASPGSDFVAIASDKHATAERLRAAGVAAPRGILLEEEADAERIEFPAVLKLCDGAGSCGVRLIRTRDELSQAAPLPGAWRLETFQAGLPASVSFLCGPAEYTPLPACRQLLSDDGAFRYLGGAAPLPAPLARRAERLGRAALAAMPRAVGYVGIDLVLGAAEDGSQDVVIEINPRLTTSYIGLRRCLEENLAHVMLRAAWGEPIAPLTLRSAVRFTAEGDVETAPA